MEQQTPKKSPGRPKKQTNKRSNLVRAMLTDDELKILNDYCEEENITKSQFIQNSINALKKR